MSQDLIEEYNAAQFIAMEAARPGSDYNYSIEEVTSPEGKKFALLAQVYPADHPGWVAHSVTLVNKQGEKTGQAFHDYCYAYGNDMTEDTLPSWAKDIIGNIFEKTSGLYKIL